MVDNTYSRPGWRNREWEKIYRLTFVLDSMRSLFRLLVLICVFMFKSNSLVNPKNLQCFSGLDRTRRGLEGRKYSFFFSTVWINKGT